MFDSILPAVRLHTDTIYAEFRQQPATLAQGRASEAHLNMDVNLRRLPQNIDCISKFLESLADIMLVSVADGQSEVSGQSNRKDKTAESKNV